MRIITANYAAVPAAFTRMRQWDVVAIDVAPTFGRRDLFVSLTLEVRK